ncbi:glr3019 [Gloeobacter violaceus PCC 7421]|uniref:Glr3019 protein n=2 Tax=Gloeobacter violaceus TaxID=33072 RepID=Q7NCG0_GLOVI|nr:glr3019 [Gloeobacter violaceus PCC 7421]
MKRALPPCSRALQATRVRMLLVVDANIIVGTLLREAGRTLVAERRLDLFICERAVEEALHELRKRGNAMVRQGRILPVQRDTMLELALSTLRRNIRIAPELVYLPVERQARQRIPRDPDDWPTVALALVLESGIWTEDNDFLGCGLPTWTTQTLHTHLTGGWVPT